MMKKSLWLMSFAALVLNACGGTPAINPGDDDKKDSPRNGDTKPPVDDTPADSPELIARVRTLLQTKCADCHQGGEASSRISDIMDSTSLKREGIILESSLNDSPLLNAVRGDEPKMPPKTGVSPRTNDRVPALSAQEVADLETWVNAGAPSLKGDREPIGLDFFTNELVKDLRSLGDANAGNQVYVVFNAVYNNNRYTDADLKALANAVFKALNSLNSLGNQVKGNGNGAKIVYDRNQNPIAVRFDPTEFGLNDDDIATIQRLTGRLVDGGVANCDVPAIEAIDFLGIVGGDNNFDPVSGEFEAVYSELVWGKLLQARNFLAPGQRVFDPIPEAQFIANSFRINSNVNLLDVLEAVDDNLSRENIRTLYNEISSDKFLTRAALFNSDVSDNQRLIDRLSLSRPEGGSAWLSHDLLTFNSAGTNQDFFANNFLAPSALIEDPDASPSDGGEALITLPNGLFGNVAYDGNLNLFSSPPAFAVYNPGNAANGGAIENGFMCFSCHANYMIDFKDAMFETIFKTRNGENFADFGFAAKVALPQEDWDLQFDADEQRYLNALRDVYASRAEDGSLPDATWTFAYARNLDLSNEDIAAEIGIDADTLIAQVGSVVDLQVNLKSVFGGGLSRQSFILNYGALVNQVRPGGANDLLLGCAVPEVSQIGDDGDDLEDGANDGDSDNDGDNNSGTN